MDRGWAIVRPSRDQFQPPPLFAALLVNCIVATIASSAARRFPILNHCHISPISFGNCTGNLVCHRSEKKNLGHLWHRFFGTAKITNCGQILKCFFWIQSGKIWPVSVAILRRPVPHVVFFVSKGLCFGLKRPQRMKLLAENLM